LIVSDGRSGLAEATAEFFAKAQWQRFTVHRYRDAFYNVSNDKVVEVASKLEEDRALEERSSTQANT
jgi:transposase-like protein